MVQVPPQLIFDILTAGAQSKDFPGDISPVLDANFVSALVIARYSPSEIRKVRQDLTESACLFEILSGKEFNFPYLSALVNGVPDVDETETEAYEFAGLATLYAFIAWFNEYKFQNKLPAAQPLLKALLHVFKSSYSSIVSQTFQSVVDIFLTVDREQKVASIGWECAEFARRVVCPGLVIQLLRRLFDTNMDIEDEVWPVIGGLVDGVAVHESFFDDANLLTVVDIVYKYITAPEIMRLLIAGSKSMTNETAKKVMMFVGKGVINDLETRKKVELPKTPAGVTAQRVTMSAASTLSLDFLFGLNDTDATRVELPVIPELIEFESLFDEPTRRIIKDIKELLRNRRAFCEYLVTSFMSDLPLYADGDMFPSIFLVMLSLCKAFIRHDGDDIMFKSPVAMQFFSARIFSPTLTVFDQGNDYNLINTIRAYALEAIMTDNGEALSVILSQQLNQWPMLLAETFLRLSDMTRIISERCARCPKLVKSITTISMTYRAVELTKTFPKEPILAFRSSWLRFLKCMFSDSETVVHFFQNTMFCSHFFLFIFDEIATEFVVKAFHTFLLSASMEQVIEISPVANGMLKMLVSQFPDETRRTVLLALLKDLNNALEYKREIVVYYASFGHDLLECISSLEASQESQNFVSEVLHLCTLSSGYFAISDQEVDILIHVFHKLQDSGFVMSMYNRFIQLLAGNCLSSITPTFVIKQPQAFKLIFNVFFDTSHLIKMIEFFYDLCKFSPLNVNECATSELDLYIIAVFEAERQKESLSFEVAQMLLSLFELLSARRSTAQAVYRFISLLSPVGDNVLSKYNPLFTKSLETLISKSLHEPSSTFRLNDRPMDVKLKEDSSLVTNGWSFAFWIYLEDNFSDRKLTICKLTISKVLEYSLTLCNRVLYMGQDDGELESVAKLGTIPSLHEWHFVCVSLTFDTGRIFVSSLCDLNDVASMIMSQPVVALDGADAVLQIGSSSELVQFPSRTAYFGVFKPLTPESMISLFQTGLRFTGAIPGEPICYFRDFGKRSDKTTTGFVDVLGQNCGLQVLLPIFNRRGMFYGDGSADCFTITNGLQLLTSLLSLSLKTQEVFFENDGFVILRRIIEEVWIDEYNMAVYMELFQCMQVINSPDLHNQLFTEILGDFSLLSKLDDGLQLRILQHWRQSLFLSIEQIATLCPFSNLVASLMTMYSGPSHEMLRKQMFQVMHLYVECGAFDRDAFISTIGFCLTCTDVSMLSELIKFLGRAISLPENAKMAIDSEGIPLMVSFLLRSPFEHIHIAVLDMLMCCYMSGPAGAAFITEVIFGALQDFPSEALNEKVFNHAVSCLPQTPILLSVVACMAYNANIDDWRLCIEKLPPSNAYCCCEFWAMWPLILTTRCAIASKYNIVTFLFECNPSDMYSIFSQIVVVFSRFSEIYSDMTDIFMCIVRASTTKNATPFYEICRFLLFYECVYTEPNKKRLMVRRAGTDWRLGKPVFKDMLDAPHQALLNRYNRDRAGREPDPFDHRVVFESVSNFLSFVFLVKMDKNGRWKHTSLVHDYLAMFDESPNPDELFCVLCLCGFLQCTGYGAVNKYIETLTLTEFDVSRCRTAVELVQYHTARAGREQFFDVGGKVICSPLVSEAKYNELVMKVSPSNFCNRHAKIVAAVSILRSKHRDHARKSEAMYTKFTSMVSERLQKFKTILGCHKGEREWVNLWRALSRPNAPWHRPWSWSETALCRSECVGFSFNMTRMHGILETCEVRTTGKLVFEAVCKRVWWNGSMMGKFQLFEGGIVFEELYVSIGCIQNMFLRVNGFEIFTVFGGAYLFLCSSVNPKDILTHIQDLQPKSLVYVQLIDTESVVDGLDLWRQWSKGEMSTYEYISMLNVLSGRSFNDRDNYPIFPWLLEQFDQAVDVFSNPNIRDLRKSVKPPRVTRGDIEVYLDNIYPGHNRVDAVPDNLPTLFQRADSELSPEFFALPEIFSHAFQLPSWARDGLEFVYHHRKLLETGVVSAKIHHWFTSLWCSTDRLSGALFTEPHPARGFPMLSPELEEPIGYQLRTDSFAHCILTSTKPLSFVAIVLMLSGYCEEFIVDLKCAKGLKHSMSRRRTASENDMKKRESEEQGKLCARMVPSVSHQKRKTHPFSSPVIIASDWNVFVVLESQKLFVIKKTGKSPPIKLPMTCCCVAVSGRWIVAGTESSEVVILKDEDVYTITKVYQSPIESLAVSETFKIYVAAISTGVAICDLVSGDVYEVIPTNLPPKKLLISPAWGFIVIYSAAGKRQTVSVLTINGKPVNETHLDTDVECWHTMASSKAFDYLIYANSAGQLYARELYFMKNSSPFHDCEGRVRSLGFNNNSMTCTVVKDTGEILFLPLAIHDIL